MSRSAAHGRGTVGGVVRRFRADGVGWFAREIWRRAYRRVSVGSLPERLHVEISNCCNMRCEYCVLDTGAVGDRIMSQSTFERVLPALRGAKSIAFSGLAEPLMNRRLPELLARVRASSPRAILALTTNASLLTRRISEQLVDNGLDELVFSLDGTDPLLVDDIRRGGSLETLVENISVLQEVKRGHGSERPRLAAAMVLQLRTVGTLPAVIQLAARMGVTAVNVNGLEPYVDQLVGEPVWIHAPASNQLHDAVERADSIARETGINLRFPSFEPLPACCPEILSPFVLADGSVVPCSVLAYPRRSLLGVTPEGRIVRHEAINERVAFGNVNDSSLAQIWGDPAYREFRRAVASREFPTACASCLMKHGVICPNPPQAARAVLAALENRRGEAACPGSAVGTPDRSCIGQGCPQETGSEPR